MSEVGYLTICAGIADRVFMSRVPKTKYAAMPRSARQIRISLCT